MSNPVEVVGVACACAVGERRVDGEHGSGDDVGVVDQLQDGVDMAGKNNADDAGAAVVEDVFAYSMVRLIWPLDEEAQMVNHLFVPTVWF